ncbi:conserved hypothetical protein [Desulfamplus magnetovallimortis]|uniref:Putative restriction endonuclease domain-containing protein n=1 Tax=Desulfamplus magnetovallimortis TaxID=1246637 RepID=A0A1W1HEC0_9BACT|nr:Uma2 family endonuclease [Desulfamplus magnetovallimortis]SLM30844.1 conserved hypothetical protein [Desulfamplus magnetovallimortis]
MNAQPQEKVIMTSAQYLEFEKNSEIKHEYFDGAIFAMTGASVKHNRIQHNISRVLGNKLLNSQCDVFSNDMRVKIEQLEKYTYPDILVVCGDIEIENIKGVETILNPLVIIEILSDSTEAYDRGDKFKHYQFISSLREYILVSQHSYWIEKYKRAGDGQWIYSSCNETGHSITIDSIGCELLLEDIYYRVIH